MNEVNVTNLYNCVISILQKCGVPQGDAEIITDSIIYAHKRGKHTHGIGRLSIYCRKIKEGLMSETTPLPVIKDSSAIALLDAQNGFGQVAGIKGMDLCVEKAKKYGIGLVAVKDSNNFGTAGFIGERAVKAGMIGIVLANSGPAIAPTGGAKALFGTNPICAAFPMPDGFAPIIFDMACSNAARGKIRLAAKTGEKIPFGWAVDAEGKDTDDPNEALKGTMIPIGGHKGYGIALCVDILAGLLTGSAFGGEVKNLNHPTEKSRYGHMLLAINPDIFMDKEEYEEKMSFLAGRIKACGAADRIYLPGEKSFATALANEEKIMIKQKLIDDMISLAIDLGIKREEINL